MEIMVMVVGLYLLMAAVLAVLGIRAKRVWHLVGAVWVVVTGLLWPVMNLVIRQIPSTMPSMLVISATFALFASVVVLGYIASYVAERCFAPLERRWLEAEGTDEG